MKLNQAQRKSTDVIFLDIEKAFDTLCLIMVLSLNHQEKVKSSSTFYTNRKNNIQLLVSFQWSRFSSLFLKFFCISIIIIMCNKKNWNRIVLQVTTICNYDSSHKSIKTCEKNINVVRLKTVRWLHRRNSGIFQSFIFLGHLLRTWITIKIFLAGEILSFFTMSKIHRFMAAFLGEKFPFSEE